MKDLEKRLTEDFRDREYREGYAEAFLHSWIAQQLAAIRRERGLTQAELGKLIGTQQAGVSRMEREDYGRWNLATLQKVAFALDCRLKVSFESWGSLLHEAANFDEESLRRPAFDEDPVFAGECAYPEMAEPGPLGEMRRKLIPWLLDEGPVDRLAEWLQGYDLPATGDEISPARWLLSAVPPSHPELLDSLARQVARAMLYKKPRWYVRPPATRGEDFVCNLLALVAALQRPLILAEPVWEMFESRKEVPLPESTAPYPGHPLVRAITHNQQDARYRSFWREHFLAERADTEMPAYAATGLIGFSYMGCAPNAAGVGEGAGGAKRWTCDLSRIVDILQHSFSQVWREFPNHRRLGSDVLDVAESEGWSQPIVRAWFLSKPPAEDTRKHRYFENAVKIGQSSTFLAAA